MAEQVVRHFINGEYRESASGKTFPIHAPEHGGVVGEVFEAGREEVDAAVAAAKAALAGPWGQLTAQERAKLLHRVADRINVGMSRQKLAR